MSDPLTELACAAYNEVMKFALIGDHPDGLDMARALAATRRHELHAYAGSALGAETLHRDGHTPKRAVDLEDVLADPEVQLVIIAGSKATRGAALRRAVQSERHVFCVHPADSKPDLAFEASMMQADTGKVVLPLLPEAFHPGVARLAQLVKMAATGVLEMRRDSQDDFWIDLEGDNPRPGVPGWDVLRRIGGEIVEVYGLTAAQEARAGQPLLISGQFEGGGLFHASFQSRQAESFWRIALVGRRSLALVFPEGFPGPATLTFEDEHGSLRSETWPATSPWSPLIDAFERMTSLKAFSFTPGKTDDHCWTSAPVGRLPTAAIQAAETMVSDVSPRDVGPCLGWTDEIRALELDDSIRRSLHYRRAYTLDLQEATEESTFKGTMTLVGCSLMWIVLVLLFLSIWVPWLGWFIFPALAIFLGLQFLRGVVKS